MELERIKSALEAEKERISEEQNNLKLTEQERQEHSLLTAKLRGVTLLIQSVNGTWKTPILMCRVVYIMGKPICPKIRDQLTLTDYIVH